jgi:hypothetical protein
MNSYFEKNFGKGNYSSFGIYWEHSFWNFLPIIHFVCYPGFYINFGFSFLKFNIYLYICISKE